jgi:hypothetical protein
METPGSGTWALARRRRAACLRQPRCARHGRGVNDAAWARTHPSAHYCNIIEAPWLVNGGHGASLRHNNAKNKARRLERRAASADLDHHRRAATAVTLGLPRAQRQLLADVDLGDGLRARPRHPCPPVAGNLLLTRRARNALGTATQCTRRNDSPPSPPPPPPPPHRSSCPRPAAAPAAPANAATDLGPGVSILSFVTRTGAA